MSIQYATPRGAAMLCSVWRTFDSLMPPENPQKGPSTRSGGNSVGRVPRPNDTSNSQSTPPPPSKRGRRLNLLYGAQIGESPPRFSIKVNDRKLVSREWSYHLENRMREEWGLDGVPLIIDFAGRKP